jgi:choline dehydrogenase-like flavoprotein
MSDISLSDIADQKWDVIIVGTGVGGATLGYALAKAGKRVLFCEKGRSHLDVPNVLLGSYAESFFPEPEVPQPQHGSILSKAGRYNELIEDRSQSRSQSFIPFIGSGTGGSSALYGMALERFFPSDFSPRRNHPDAPETTLPEEWPITYETLAPYYKAAEQLYRVRGTEDPLRGEEAAGHLLQPPPLTAGSHELFDFFKNNGLHPYRLPLACEYVPGCECCQGYLCAKNCKNDSARICLKPAISQYGARLLDECNVLTLEASRDKVTRLICSWRGNRVTLRAQVIVLAAGALETPAILLRSSSEIWPEGLANDSGMVGRNLMRHHINLYLVTPKTLGPQDNRQKELAFNDLYQADGNKFGSVQSFGRLPPAPLLAVSMEQDIRNGKLPWVAPLFKLITPLVKPVLNRLSNHNIVLATIMEDLPYEDNRVRYLPPIGDRGPRLTLNYHIRTYDAERIRTFNTMMIKILKPYRPKLIKQAENNQRLAHACGTCRFGSTSEESVLNPYNRAHNLSNLYVVDGSFFPSSAGTNPSLTIAANALRVADHLLGEI